MLTDGAVLVAGPLLSGPMLGGEVLVAMGPLGPIVIVTVTVAVGEPLEEPLPLPGAPL